MEYEIHSLHDSYSDDAADLVRERMRLLERIEGGASHVRAVLEREDERRHRVELVASSWGRSVHRAEVRSDTLLSAVNDAVHRLERALRRREDRHRDLQRRSGGAA